MSEKQLEALLFVAFIGVGLTVLYYVSKKVNKAPSGTYKEIEQTIKT